jgi:uncharacterized membrane protein
MTIVPLLFSLSLAAATADAPPAAPAARLRGELALARGALGFAPCDGQAGAVVDGRAAGEAARLVPQLNGGADGSVFIDADIAQEADGRWRIDRVRRAYRDGPRCAEDLGEFVWRAADAAGAWTLSVSRRYLTLRRAGQPALFFRYQPFTAAEQGAWTYAGRSGTHAIHVVMYPRRCESPGALHVTDWAVVFSIAGSRFEGCAWTGEPR